MKVLNKDVLRFAAVLVGGYSLYTQPLGTALSGIGIAAIVFALTHSLEGVLLVLVATLFIKKLNKLLVPKPEPMGVEAFQARDPVSIQARLEHVKVPAPKVEAVSGVLESASILNNTPLHASQEGVPGASIPSGVKARALIYPPAEDTIPAPSESMHLTPKENPYLQTGQDHLAHEVSLAQKGTDMYAQGNASEVAGVATGAGPAF